MKLSSIDNKNSSIYFGIKNPIREIPKIHYVGTTSEFKDILSPPDQVIERAILNVSKVNCNIYLSIPGLALNFFLNKCLRIPNNDSLKNALVKIERNKDDIKDLKMLDTADRKKFQMLLIEKKFREMTRFPSNLALPEKVKERLREISEIDNTKKSIKQFIEYTQGFKSS